MGVSRMIPRRLPPVGRTVAIISAIVVAAVLGVVSAHEPSYAFPIAVGILLVGVAAFDLSLIPVLAVPATLVMIRVAGDALTVSDLVLAVSTVVALILVRAKEMRPMQPLLWGGAAYLGTAIPTQILNPYTANIVEWVHEVFLVLGSMVVGFAIGRYGHARLALSLYVVLCCVIGVVAGVTALVTFGATGAFQPAYLPQFELHKNTIGGMLAIGAVIAFARPRWLGWGPLWAYTALVLCSVGMLAAQSRQGILGAVAGGLLVALRPRPQSGKRSKLIWLVSIPIAVVVWMEVAAQLDSDNIFNSAHQRLTWYERAVEIWLTSPLFGAGLRWWYTDRFDAHFQPPNVELEVLTTVGIFGLLGFMVMFVVAFIVLMRMDPVYGTLGAAIVLARFVQAQFDLYWVAGQASLLWIIAGICFGVQEYERWRGRLDAGPADTAIARDVRRL